MQESKTRRIRGADIECEEKIPPAPIMSRTPIVFRRDDHRGDARERENDAQRVESKTERCHSSGTRSAMS